MTAPVPMTLCDSCAAEVLPDIERGAMRTQIHCGHNGVGGIFERELGVWRLVCPISAENFAALLRREASIKAELSATLAREFGRRIDN